MKFEDYLKEGKDSYVYKLPEDVTIDDVSTLNIKPGKNKLDFYWKDSEAYFDGYIDIESVDTIVLEKGSKLVLPYKLKGKNKIYDEAYNEVSEWLARN